MPILVRGKYRKTLSETDAEFKQLLNLFHENKISFTELCRQDRINRGDFSAYTLKEKWQKFILPWIKGKIKR
jgi:hypothetical protein